MPNYKLDFDRFLDVVTRRRLPDRVPLVDGAVDPEIMDAFLGRPVANVRDFVEFWKTAGYDYIILYIRGQPIPDHSVQFKIGQRHVEPLAHGASTSTFDVAMGVKDEEGFETYPWVGPEDIYYDDVDAVRDELPDGMKLVVCQGPLFSGIWRMMGMETFSTACVENPELVRAISNKIGQMCVKIAEEALQREWVGAYWLGDDLAYTTSLIASPQFLRGHVFPYYKRIGELCQQHGKPFLWHSDGNTTQVFGDIIDCGVASVHPNEPSSVDIVELKRQYGDRLSFIGGIDVDMMARGTPEEIRNRVKYLIDHVAPGGGFAVSGGNSIAKYVPLENYKALRDATREFGKVYS